MSDTVDCDRAMKPKADHSEYRDRLIEAAGEIIASDGLEGLTAGKLASHVGLRRTVVHYHFGTMDHLLAALIRQSFAATRDKTLARLELSSLGQALWDNYSVNMPAADAIRARALANPVVGEAYREVFEALKQRVSELLDEAHRVRGIVPEIPTADMAAVIMMSAQFVGAQRTLRSSTMIAPVEAYLKSLFAITAERKD